MEEDKCDENVIERVNFTGTNIQILVLALQAMMYQENRRSYKDVRITALKGKGLTFVCQDEGCSSTAMIKASAFETFNVLSQKFDRGELVENSDQVIICINPKFLVDFLKLIPSDRSVKFEYPVGDNQLKVSTGSDLQGLGDENYFFSDSFNISTTSSEFIKYSYPQYSQDDICSEIFVGSRVFKKILKEFADLGKDDLLRFQYSVESNKLQIMHRDEFKVDSDYLPSVINENDGSSFRSIEIKALNLQDDYEDIENKDCARYYRINTLRFVFSRLTKDSKECQFTIFGNGNLRIYFIFDENPLIEFTVKCHQNDDEIESSSDAD
ncbi:unnamed protein product [Moneuplotes crassus]|uniref:Uncharacterized protein n=1 Tax=Euplotes crassus TaxID=5936 RepID=A0AAD1XE87_EUPCR|nr:unnamed protein product [Moneuplotes crassus]